MARVSRRLICLPAVVLLAGCIERTVSINTEPQGATVFLNDQEVGQSPVKAPFTWYGDYDIVIRKSGYKSVKTHKNIATPWYELPGIDLFTECFMPFTVHDDRQVEAFVLEKQELPTKEALLKSAEELKQQAMGG